MIGVEKQVKGQVIIITGNRDDARFEIVIPPFRPISMFEIEDDLDAVLDEISNTVYDEDIAAVMTDFIQAFHDAIDKEDMYPLVDYFIRNNVKGLEAQDMKLIFDSVKEYIDYSTDTERLMH